MGAQQLENPRSPPLPNARRNPATAASPDTPAERREAADRRRHSAWSFLYGGVRPRRIFLDWHEPRVLYLALAILLMSCADALFTLNLLAVGGEELNVVMRLLLERGTHWFLWSKIGLTAVSVVVLVAAARRRVLGRIPVLWLIKLCFAGYLLLIGWELHLLYGLVVDQGGAGLPFEEWIAG